MALKLSGSAEDIQSFLDMLSECAGLDVYTDSSGNVTRAAGPPTAGNAPFVEALDELLSEENELTITVGRGQEDIVGDDFCKRELDLNDIERFPSVPPADSPSAFTRCEALIHIIKEYAHALKEGRTSCTDGFDGAHREGKEAQEEHRAAKGQPEGEIHGQIFVPPNQGVTIYCNGARTTVTLDDGNITNVEHEEPEEEEPEEGKEEEDNGVEEENGGIFGIDEQNKMKELFENSDVVFVGKVLKVGAPPPLWSSFYKSYQEVTYKILLQLKGFGIIGSKEKFYHLIIEKSKLSPGSQPGLSEELFARGQKLLVFASLRKHPLQKGMFRFEIVDGNYGALPSPTKQIISLFRILTPSDRYRDKYKKGKK